MTSFFRINRRTNKRRVAVAIALCITLFISFPTLTGAQEVDPSLVEQEAATTPANTSDAADSSFYFADVLVRDRPIFEVGGLADIDARSRAAIINRRISSVLSNPNQPNEMTVEFNSSQQLATLKVNNRVIMTVTQQDADDFGTTVERLAERWADQLNEAFDKPPLIIDVTQRLGATIRQLARDAIDKLPALLGACIVILITWGAAGSVRYAAFNWAQRTEGDRSTEVLIGRLGYGAVWIFGSVIALSLLGLELGALLGAFGLTSVAIGFSLKDVLSNYISGVILLAARPFRIGDQVVIEGYEGTITQIQLRATTLRTYDGRIIYLPNQEVFQANITNNTASPYLRSSIIVGIDYDANISYARQKLTSAVRDVQGVSSEHPIDVLVQELSASTVNLEIRFWVDSHRGEFLETSSAAAQVIKETLQTAGVEMPTDIYTLQFRNSPNLNLNSSKSSQEEQPHSSE
ncbi:MAG: mechanosensitive ion channel family protein [Leptolyngbyaceae bacterium]|nr:mechanosensitive ion channel family protein [Leptolyngbyaceae bacterium]